ncbi:MAG: MMPL family transporter [Pirellulaceae bacterium]
MTSIVMICAGPFLASWSMSAVDTMFNTPHLWIPKSNEQRQDFEWFVNRFESQAIVVLSWSGCTIDDQRLAEFERVLLDSERPNFERRAALIDRVQTGYTIVRQLTTSPIGLRRTSAISRLRGGMIGPDGISSCAVVVLTDQGGYERGEAIEIILETAESVCKLKRSQLYLAGPPVDGDAIDRAGVATMQKYAALSVLLSLLLCWWFLGDWRYALAVFAVAVFGEGLCLSMVGWSGEPMNAVLILMPPFVFVLTIAAGIHLVNYYFDEAKQHGIAGAPQRAIRVGWVPCVLAAMTTCIGLSSLLTSEVEPIRQFGFFASIGSTVTLLLLFCLLPGLMELCPLSKTEDNRRRVKRELWGALASFTIVRAKAITFGSIMLLFIVGWGLLSIETSIKIRELFSPRDRVLTDYIWMEENLGPMVPVEVVIHFAADTKIDFLRRIELVDSVAKSVSDLEHVDGVMSAGTFTPPIPKGASIGNTARRVALSRKLADERSRFRDGRYLYEGEGRQSWRIAARVPAISDVDYEVFLDELRDHVAPVVDSASASNDEEIDITVTGAVPLIYQTQRLLLADMIRSFVAAFALVGLILMVVLRSVWAGLFAMIPNVFPIVTIFGLMGWCAIPINLGTVMTASIALGIAVVDTLHFLSWFRREIDAGYRPSEAIRRTYSHCATAMLQTSLICGLGMLPVVFSSFVPASRFSWMVFILLMTALVADLLILPALLAGPLGKVFMGSKASESSF